MRELGFSPRKGRLRGELVQEYLKNAKGMDQALRGAAKY